MRISSGLAGLAAGAPRATCITVLVPQCHPYSRSR